MKAKAEFLKVDQMELAISITMPLGDWKALRAQMPTSWPSCDLVDVIREAVRQAEGNFRVTTRGGVE